MTATSRADDGAGIRPIAPGERSLSGLDLAILWGDLGIGLLVMVTGALLVPALGFGEALLAIIIGSLIGVTLLAVAAAPGADHGLPTMVLLRPVLGLRGSWVPTAINVAQLIGWTAVELWAMSYVADLVSRRVLGFGARPLWLAIVAGLCAGLALWGPIGVTRVWMKRFAAWGIAAICLAVSALVIFERPEVFRTTGVGGWPSFGGAVDLVIAMPISWLPLVADYTRFARSRGAAVGGTFAGYLVANIWLYTLGVVLVSGAGSPASPAGIAAAVLSLAGGSIAGLIFLAGLLVGETDEAFADVYSTNVSLHNVFPRLRSDIAIVVVVLVSAVLAAGLTMERYESFLFLLGSVFVPLFGLLFADHFVNRRGRIAIDDLDRAEGKYWFWRGVRPAAFVAWLAGFVVFQWLAPAGPAWWRDALASLWGASPLTSVPWLPASIPAFAVAFVLGLALRGGTAGIVEPSRVQRSGGEAS